MCPASAKAVNVLAVRYVDDDENLLKIGYNEHFSNT